MRKTISAALALSLASLLAGAREPYELQWEATARLGASSGAFAPSYTAAHTHGRVFSSATALAEGAVWRPVDLSRRFSYGFGVDLIAGFNQGAEYERYMAAEHSWTLHRPAPARFWVQQLWGEVKYRGVFLMVGCKEFDAPLLNNELSSGDLIHSGNTRPIPQARIGFVDFQNIPFTNGWVQIQGEIAYGHYTDSDWWADRINRWNGHYTSGQWYNYKRCFFRTKPSMPFSVTVGMQATAQFGGTEYRFEQGRELEPRKHTIEAKTFFHTFIPWGNGKEGFYEGNHLGSWDFHARYRFRSGHELKAYIQKPWEDGSGIGWMNGFDGLWGLEWSLPDGNSLAPWLKGVVVEYLDLTNQSGPTHFAPGDYTGATIPSEATGADDYYNNVFYSPYAVYGMAQGSPLVMAPIYNRDGYMAFIANRMRAFHAALDGHAGNVDWRLRAGWRKGYGNAFIILPKPLSAFSMAADIEWQIPSVKGLALGAQMAFDTGSMPRPSAGGLITVKYSGLWKL